MAGQGIGSDGPSEETVHKMLEVMGDAAIERLKASDAGIHRGRRMPTQEEMEPPPPLEGPAKLVSVARPGRGLAVYLAGDGVEVTVATTERSSARLRGDAGGWRGAAGTLIFRVGWPGVPAGWHHAAKLMRLGDVASFEVGIDDVWGAPGGSFEALLEGPRPAGGSTVELELELRERAEYFRPADVPEGLPAGFWCRLADDPCTPRPSGFARTEAHLRVWAAPDGALNSDAPHVPRGDPLYDSRSPGEGPVVFTPGDGALCDILERAVLSLSLGDTLRMLLDPSLLSAPGAVGHKAPAGLGALVRGDAAASPAPLELEVSDLAFEPLGDPRTLSPKELLERVQGLREEGNLNVKQGQHRCAERWYDKGLEVLDKSKWKEKVLEGSELDKLVRAAKLAILTNLSLCHLQGEYPAYRKAIEICNQALEIEPASIKAMFRKGKAHAELGEHGEAEDILARAASLEPKDAAIRKELERVRKGTAKSKKSQKTAFGGMFSRLKGFAADDRQVTSDDGSNDRLYCVAKKPEENPYADSNDARDDAASLEAEGKLEHAIWAWEAAVANRQDCLDFPVCWLCWFNLGRLYIDLTADRTALLCFERFVHTGDLPAPPSTLLRHVHLLRAFCVLNVADDPETRLAAVEACMGRWLGSGGQQASDSLEARLEAEASHQNSASAVDAAVALGLLKLTREGPTTATIQAIAYAVALPEAAGSLFGDPARPAAKWNFLGTALAQERPEHALLAFSKALETQQHYPRALVNLGLALSNLGRWGPAVAAYAAAARLMPGFSTEGLWQTIDAAVPRADVAAAAAAAQARDASALLSTVSPGATARDDIRPALGLAPAECGKVEVLAQMGIVGESPASG